MGESGGSWGESHTIDDLSVAMDVNKDPLGVIVVDGPWTAATLGIMAKVFDYVVPLSASARLAEIIEAYLNGDKSKLKWIIDFRITATSS
jgi:hypothetical protein